MGKFLNFLLIVSFLVLIALIGINYYADKEIAKYHVNPITVGSSKDAEINNIIDTATVKVKNVSKTLTNTLSQKGDKKESLGQTPQNSQTNSTVTTTKSLPQVPKNVNQTYFNSSK